MKFRGPPTLSDIHGKTPPCMFHPRHAYRVNAGGTTWVTTNESPANQNCTLGGITSGGNLNTRLAAT